MTTKLILILVPILAIIVLVSIVLLTGKSKPQFNNLPPVVQQPSPNPTVGFALGQNLSQLVQQNGNPIKTEALGNLKVYYYPNKINNKRQDAYYIISSTVTASKQAIISDEVGTLKDFFNQYGKADLVLYGPHQGFLYNVYLKQGKIVVANASDGIIIELYSFVPADQNTFMSQLAQPLSLTTTPNVTF
ncbi:hypothetical protein HY389_00595 [Candidatus Daviesbacteria bacterium]|nr:hypothetical protein [Candidatus Daviesbacteria bacterium]